MNRPLVISVITALVLPLLVLGGLIGQQEWLRVNARLLSVPLIGYDPRDLLRGHYIRAEMDWTWESASFNSYRGREGALCVLATTPKPRVRFLDGWRATERADADCILVIAGYARAPHRFVPGALDNGDGSIQLFIPEAKASALEKALRERPGSLTVDLAVRSDGKATIKALRLDGAEIFR